MIQQSASRWQSKDWQLALKTMLRSVEALCEYVGVAIEDLEKAQLAHKDFPVRVPTAYADQIEKGNLHDPLLLQVLPQTAELIETSGFVEDPLNEAAFNKTPGLIHKYHGRVLFITSPSCAINCRYCFRRHFPYQDNNPNMAQWQQALDYIRADNSIQEVILSGGDPLSASDDYLNKLIQAIATIPHVRWLRLHSRLPVVIPQRVTDNLLNLLTATRLQTSVVLHINHANELSTDVAEAIHLLQQRHIRVLNQSVLLRGINDDVSSHKQLLEKLHQHRVQAYYLHLLDPVKGAAHFLVDDEKALTLYEQLRQEVPGFMLPRLARETAHQPYKTLIL